MRIAVRWSDVLIDPDGHVAGHDAGATLVRRLLRIFPDSILVGDGGPRRGDGFEVLPLEFVDGNQTVVVNMNVIDSGSVWRTLHAYAPEPKVMNFVWWTTAQYSHPVERASLALSCALFPTFANSERTAHEVTEIVRSGTIAPLAEAARIAWVNLGIRLEHVHPRQEPEVPVVLYPAIYLTERKQPQLFLDIVGKVAARTPLRVEARLHESSLVSEKAMAFGRRKWAWVGPLTASRSDYWDALSRTTAFLATATDESYGLEYVEALVAGAVGVLPDRPWARALVPQGYPFLYRTPAEAEEMLYRAVTDTAACRKQLDEVAGGSFTAWLGARHDDDAFDRTIRKAVTDWFGA